MNSSGNVGIGTTTSSQKLEFVTTALTNFRFYASGLEQMIFRSDGTVTLCVKKRTRRKMSKNKKRVNESSI